MPQFQIIHTTDPEAMMRPIRSLSNWGQNRDVFTLVAIMDTFSHNNIFALTNHGGTQENWLNNPEVTWHLNQPIRSTSVGDIIVCAEQRQAWLITGNGYTRINHVIFPPTKEEIQRQDAYDYLQAKMERRISPEPEASREFEPYFKAQYSPQNSTEHDHRCTCPGCNPGDPL